MTDAWRSPRFSSCRAFTRSLYVSSSTLSTRLCCCSDSIRFCSCSRVTGDGGIIIGPPSIELESLSDALSRSAMFQATMTTATETIGTPVIAGCSSHEKSGTDARVLPSPALATRACRSDLRSRSPVEDEKKKTRKENVA